MRKAMKWIFSTLSFIFAVILMIIWIKVVYLAVLFGVLAAVELASDIFEYPAVERIVKILEFVVSIIVICIVLVIVNKAPLILLTLLFPLIIIMSIASIVFLITCSLR